MMNQLCLIGRLASDPIITENENGIKTTEITMVIPRSFKNKDGEYDNDFINCVVFNGIDSSMLEKGMLLGIKGRLSSTKDKDAGTLQMKVLAEKLTLLSTRQKTEMER